DKYLQHEKIVFVPVGSTEEHGPAGPLGVDAYVVIALAEDAAQRSGVLCATPVWFGDSSHHSGFPVTISILTGNLMLLIRDICRHLALPRFTRIVLILGP